MPLLATIAFLLTQSDSGVDRYKRFMSGQSSYAVDLTITYNTSRPAKGSLIVSKPGSIRFSVDWGPENYTYIQHRGEAIEFATNERHYQQYQVPIGLRIYPSAFSKELQEIAVPTELLQGDLRALAPGGAKFTKKEGGGGNETYTTTWNAEGGRMTLTATLGKDGRLVVLDSSFRGVEGLMRIVRTYSNYRLKPTLDDKTFDTNPPLGYTAYSVPLLSPRFSVGSRLTFGKWTSSDGKSVEDAVKGKLVIVREAESPLADGLNRHLSGADLPVGLVSLSLGRTGGDYRAPSLEVATALGSMGTPLLILMDDKGVVKRMWLGFDPDAGERLVTEIKDAIAGKED